MSRHEYGVWVPRWSNFTEIWVYRMLYPFLRKSIFIVFYYLCVVGCHMVSGIRESKYTVMLCKSEDNK